MLELISKSQRQLEKQYNNILKDIESSRDENRKIVEHTKEFTLQFLNMQKEEQKQLTDEFKISILLTQEKEKASIFSDLALLKDDLGKLKEESHKNDSILEKNLTDLIVD